MPGVIPPIITVSEEGTAIAKRPTLNFIGASVTASDNAASNRTDVTISAIGGGSYPATVLTPLGGGQSDSAQFQAALDTVALAGGGEIVLNGILLLTTGCGFQGGGLLLRGTGMYGSGLKAAAGSEGITLLTLGANAGGGAATRQNLNIVRDMGFFSTNQKTAGAGIRLTSTGSYSRVLCCWFSGQYNSIEVIEGAQLVNIDHCIIFSYTNDGILVNGADANNPLGSGASWIISNTDIYSPSAVGAGIHHRGRDALRIHNCAVVLSGKHGLWVDPDRDGSPPLGFSMVSDSYFDTHFEGYGVFIDGRTYMVAGYSFVNCWLGTNKQGGLCVMGQYAGGIRWNGGMILENESFGIGIFGATDVGIFNALIGRTTRNSMNGPGPYDPDGALSPPYGRGIVIGSGTTGFQIMNNRIQTLTAYNTKVAQTSAGCGIQFRGSHNNHMVTGNDLRDNAYGATVGTYTGANYVYANNLT